MMMTTMTMGACLVVVVPVVVVRVTFVKHTCIFYNHHHRRRRRRAVVVITMITMLGVRARVCGGRAGGGQTVEARLGRFDHCHHRRRRCHAPSGGDDAVCCICVRVCQRAVVG